jgi:uroporphyrin-III C-methyltransferase
MKEGLYAVPSAAGGSTLKQGKAWLIGAGPGDPELLTLKAVKVLRQAEVVLVDDLVAPEVLAYCPQARVVRVGKRGGCRSTPQDFILRLMLRHARQGRLVARLKGGDPCVFGRAGEEARWLDEHGIACEIVNGVTAGFAAASACGIPLTLRGVARGVTLITAHAEDGSTPDWSALAGSGTTLVVYMGATRMQEIRARLLAGGMPAATPVSMVENATLPRQRECPSTLADMVEDAAAFGLRSPAILVIGEVVAHAVRGAALEQGDADGEPERKLLRRA